MVDTKELELPDTTYVRDIENRVFQGIVLQSLAEIPGICPIEGNFIDSFLGRQEGVKGIHTEQDPESHSVSIKVDVNVAYGVSIPQKADEIQAKITEDVTKMTGLHVAQVHVVFKGLILPESQKKQNILQLDTKQCCNKPV
jgi:uncharacterized alkaline shock family protein YloU